MLKKTMCITLLILLAACLPPLAYASSDAELIADSNGCKASNAYPTSNETITWTGACKDGLLDGHGTLTWLRNGALSSSYQGEFVQGRLEGQGSRTMPDGTIFSGQYEHGRLSGKGTVNYSNGTRYQGDLVQSQMQGHGVLIYPDGTRYEGEFAKNQRDGSGFWTRNGRRTDTSFVAGKETRQFEDVADNQMPASCSNTAEVSKSAVYPAFALRNGVYGGTVEMHFIIEADGHISISSLDSSNPVFNETAIGMIRALRCLAQGDVRPVNWNVGFSVEGTTMNQAMALTPPSDITDGRRLLILIDTPFRPELKPHTGDNFVRDVSERVATNLSAIFRRRRVSVAHLLDMTAAPIGQKIMLDASSAHAHYVIVLRSGDPTPNLDGKINILAEYYEIPAASDGAGAERKFSQSFMVDLPSFGNPPTGIDDMATQVFRAVAEKPAFATLEASCDGHLCAPASK